MCWQTNKNIGLCLDFFVYNLNGHCLLFLKFHCTIHKLPDSKMPNAYILGAAVGFLVLAGAGLLMWLTSPEPMAQRRRPTRPKPRSPSAEYKNETCIICTDKKATVKLHPCQHTPMCETCTETYRKYDKRCPLCRENIETVETPWSSSQ